MPSSPSPCFFTASSAPAARLLLLLHPPSTILGSAPAVASSFLQLEKRGFCGTRTTTAGMAESGEKKKAPAGGGGVVSERIMPHLLNIYGSCATARDFEIYAPNATFEDPLMRAHGVKQIKSAFYTLPKVFGESKIAEYTVEENPTGPGKTEVLIDNRQVYKVVGRTVEVASLIRLDVDQDGKVVKHEDWWDKKPLKTRDTVAFPLAGRVAEATRRGAMLLTHALMGFGKDPDTSSSSTS